MLVLNKDNKMPRVGKALAADSTAMLAGSLLGTSPVGAYVESSAGIAVGGRSGITAITTGIVTTANKGENSKLKINKIPVVIAVIPERPPTAIPADDSTYL
jgi:hypothetical protein